MTQFLPPNLLVLFAARDPIPYLPPTDKPTHEKKRQPYTGVADYLTHFEDPEETPLPTKAETKREKLDRKAREKAEQNAYKLEQDLALWNPAEYENVTSDPYRTLFVARIHYDTSESKLRREFEVYGKIKQIKMVHDVETDKPRGYAFIEYEDESSMHAAYKRADGKKIDGRRVVVDIERGRTIKGWKPRRLGGGKGGRKSHYVESSELNLDDDRRDRDRDRTDRFDDRGRDRGDRDRDRTDRDKDRDRDRERRRSRDKRSRTRSKDRKKRSKSKDRSRERVKKARRSRSRDRAEKMKKKDRSRSREKKRKDADYVTDTKNGKENQGMAPVEAN